MDADNSAAASHFCPACLKPVTRFTDGPRARPNARCPHCGAMERHRLLAVLLHSLAPYIMTSGHVLDIAPNGAITRVLRRIRPLRLTQMDFDPAADGRSVDVRASIEAMPFHDDSIDVIICYHVLEHVIRDDLAMREIARVLKPGGFALVQVPWRPNSDTEEDVSAAPEERLRRFGQADHVRFYGRDFDDKLTKSGLSGARLSATNLLTPDLERLYGTLRTEPVWLLRPLSGASVGVAPAKLIPFPTPVDERTRGGASAPA